MKTNIRTSLLSVLQLLLILLIASSPGHAQEEYGPVDNSSDTAKDTIALGSTYEDKLEYWQSLSEEQKQAIREKARKLGPTKITKLKEKAQSFIILPRETQERIKINLKRFRAMSPEKRVRIRWLFRKRKQNRNRPARGKDRRDRGEDNRNRREDIRDRRKDIRDHKGDQSFLDRREAEIGDRILAVDPKTSEIVGRTDTHDVKGGSEDSRVGRIQSAV